ncbi:MAG: glutamine-hydrolyzing carbamoyl-phosphate synthase small subunit [bacterium]
MSALLVLEDGSTFEGVSIGAQGEAMGEVILNTAVVGYQELITDPANAGKILVFTYPLIGNYGVAKKFSESDRCWPCAVVMKEESSIHSNWQAEDSLGNFLRKGKQIAVSGVDTRTLAVKVRKKGPMKGIVSTKKATKTRLMKKLKEFDKNAKVDFIENISVKREKTIKGKPGGHKIAILDLGMTNGYLKQLKNLGCTITLLPYDTGPEKIMDMHPHGLIISGGPENDVAIAKVAITVGELIGEIPILGISTGHHVIAVALGGELRKLKVGHHGVNYPTKADYQQTGKITVQNHSYVVDEKSLRDEEDIEITLRNVNDDTVEEMVSHGLKFISTQYCPTSPGWEEISDVFTRFLRMVDKSL